MASKKIQCNWCQKEKEQVVNSFFAACPIIPEMEEKILNAIEKYGHEWWTELEKDDKDLCDELMGYDQATSTVGRASVCSDCIEDDEEAYAKYRKIVSDDADPYDMVKVVVEDVSVDLDSEIDVEDMERWYGEVKERIKKMKPNREK